MKSITKTFFLLALICLFLGPNRLAAEELKGHNLINKVCSENVDAKDMCIKVLRSSPESKNATLKDLATISLKAAAQYAASITSGLKKLSIDDDLDPSVEQGMADCKENYLDAEDQVEDAIAAILVNDIGDVQKWLNAALSATISCDNALDGKDPFIVVSNQEFRKLCHITLSICKDLHRDA